MDEKCIAIVDDEVSVLRSTGILLDTLGYETRPFVSGETFLSTVQPGELDCILLDVRMPGMGGLELQERLTTLGCDLPIVFITGHGDIPTAVAAVRRGAVDFIEKPFTSDRLTEAVERALKSRPRREKDSKARKEARARIARLTKREREVFDLLVQGETNKAIGRKLGISPRTVDVHRQHLRAKLEVEDLAGLIRIKRASGR